MMANIAASTLVYAGEVSAGNKPPAPQVDFSYAFATPHRLTVAVPDSSHKTLLDLQPGSLRMSWTDDDLTKIALCIYRPTWATWELHMVPQLDGQPFGTSTWRRLEGALPALDNVYESREGTMRLQVAGGSNAAMVRIEMVNASAQERRFALPATVIRVRYEASGQRIVIKGGEEVWERGDLKVGNRTLAFVVGADEWGVTDAKTAAPAWNVPPGKTVVAWLVRPYRGVEADLPAWRQRNWQAEFDAAVQTWKSLLSRAAQFQVPDPGVQHAIQACLADVFIMREPLAKGYLGCCPGTEGYRCTNPAESGIAAVALDQFGLPAEAVAHYRVALDLQEPDGDWTEPKGWTKTIWAMSGFKAWTAMEHYRLTRDRAYLEAVYPRLVASSRWQEKQRQGTRALKDGQKPVNYGLMPRGMGDCGLMDDKDYNGIFLPHNIWAVYADRLSVEAAQLLGREADLPELQKIYEVGREDLLRALDQGAIQADGYRWIPGVANKTSGSRWGVLNALTPCGLLAPEHELITGTLRFIESNISPGGIPMNTGWMKNGMWVAIALNDLAEAQLVRGNGDAAARYLYATLNHGTPLYTWCEERGPTPGAKETTGDRQHLWTPIAVLRLVRDALVLEQGADLLLATGTERSWLAQGQRIAVRAVPTHFGPLSYEITSDVDHRRISANLDLPARNPPQSVLLKLRHPQAAPIKSVTVNGKAWKAFDAAGEFVRLDKLTGKVQVVATY
ncbi:MAG: hypothetical protein WCR06_09975 [bacterium]